MGVRTSLRALEEWGPGIFPLPVEAPAASFVWRVSAYGARTAGLPAAVVSAQVARPSGGLVAQVAPGVAPQACEGESAPAISARVALYQGARHVSGAFSSRVGQVYFAARWAPCRERQVAAVVAEAPVWRLAKPDVLQ